MRIAVLSIQACLLKSVYRSVYRKLSRTGRPQSSGRPILAEPSKAGIPPAAKRADAPSFAQTLIEILPTHPFQALAEGRTLQRIVFAILLGVAMTLSGEEAAPLLRLFESANVVVMKLVFILMELEPYGVFCLIAKGASEQGFEAFGKLAGYFGCVLLVLFVHTSVASFSIPSV